MTVSPVRLLLVLITSFLCSIGYGQSLKAYRTVKVLSGQSIDIPAESIGYPDFIRRPETGSVSKFKFGYEEVYRIRYTAPHSFVGVDTVIYKTSRKVFGIAKPFFEGFVVEASPVIAQADYFAADLHAGSVNLAVLQNDLSVDGNLLISKLSYVSNGSASISGDGRSIRFTPSSTGYAKISYTVCSGGKCSAALVVVRVDDHNVLPKPDTLYYRIMRDEKATIITGPGFKPPSNTYFSGELVRTESQIFEFTPPLGYSGTEVLKFTNLIGGVQFTQVVTIAVEDPFIENGWNVEDHIYTEVGNSVIFSISDNDLGGNINSVNTNGLKGSLTSLGTGIYRYTPQSGFRGQTKFTYESCGEGRCDETTVYVTVHNYEPLYDEVKVYTTANQELKLDYRVPIDDYNFTLLRSATNGSVLISADGKSITYRPGDNFVGMDVFALAYCVGLSGECKDVLVDVNVQDVSVSGGCEGCVWPGDHNDNGQVDIQDAVVLATNIGYSGPARSGSTSSLDWYPQEAQDWPVALSFGTPNLKYVDGNGDGLISTKDFGP
ncbi:MAG: hypothetical protein KDC53_07890, partial [Saprospiraceae bacterium]|nr:hypothetical protein [Saprospiraceae bacterium]